MRFKAQSPFLWAQERTHERYAQGDNMKKFLLTVLIFVLVATTVCTLVACRQDELTLYVPDGAPALSVAKIIKDGKIGGGVKLGSQPVDAVITTGEDVVAKCSSGEADMAVLPTNAAVRICSVREDYALFSVNVYGVLYIVGTQQLTDLKQLQGKRLYSIGLGNTPEYVFKTVCDSNGVKYREYDGEETLYGEVMLKYFADASEIIPQILQGKADFALLGEPAVTQLVGQLLEKGKTAYNLFDLQKMWQDATDSDEEGYPQASMIVKKSLLENSAFQRQLVTSLSENGGFLQENADDLKDILRSAGSTLTVNFTEEVIKRCNVTFCQADSAKEDIERYLAKFKDMEQFLPIDPDIIAGATVSD